MRSSAGPNSIWAAIRRCPHGRHATGSHRDLVPGTSTPVRLGPTAPCTISSLANPERASFFRPTQIKSSWPWKNDWNSPNEEFFILVSPCRLEPRLCPWINPRPGPGNRPAGTQASGRCPLDRSSARRSEPGPTRFRSFSQVTPDLYLSDKRPELWYRYVALRKLQQTYHEWERQGWKPDTIFSYNMSRSTRPLSVEWRRNPTRLVFTCSWPTASVWVKIVRLETIPLQPETVLGKRRKRSRPFHRGYRPEPADRSFFPKPAIKPGCGCPVAAIRWPDLNPEHRALRALCNLVISGPTPLIPAWSNWWKNS